MSTNKFEMKIIDVFVIAGKTVFIGGIKSDSDYIERCMCQLIVDGKVKAIFEIEGENLFRKDLRSLRTSDTVDISKELVNHHDCKLVSC